MTKATLLTVASLAATALLVVACGESLTLEEYSAACGFQGRREIQANPYGSTLQSAEDLYTGIKNLKPPSELQAVHNAWVHAYDLLLKSSRSLKSDIEEDLRGKTDAPIHIDTDSYDADLREVEARFNQEFSKLPYNVERVLAADGCYVRIVAPRPQPAQSWLARTPMRRPKFPARSVVTKPITLLCLWATYTAVDVLVAAVVDYDVLEPDVPDTATPTTAFIQPTAVQQVPAAVATVSAPQMPFSSQTATPTPIPTPTVPSTPTPVPIREVNFTRIVTSTNLPSQVQVVFSLRDQEGHAIVLPAEQVKRGLQVSEIGPGTDGAWEEIDYTETSFFVHTAENIDLEVVFVLDFTNSMSEARLSDGSGVVDAMLRALEAALAVLPSAHRVGVVEFHDRNVSPSVLSRLTTNRQAILNSLGDFLASGFDSGSSRVWDSVVTGSNLFSSREQNPRAVRALVFLSDGRATSSDSTREQAAQYARERGVQLYAVGVGDVFQESELRSVAYSTDGAYYSAHDLDLVQEQLQLLVNDLRGQYQLTYITLRRRGEYHIGISARLAGIRGETEVGPFDVARFFAADNQEVIGYDPPSLDRANQRATVFMRAQHIPRNIDRIRFRADTDNPLRAELVQSRDGGLLEGWTLNGPDPAAGTRLSRRRPWSSAASVCWPNSLSQA